MLKKEKTSIPANIKLLIDRREEARKAKNFKEADELRQKIKELGFIVEDTTSGPKCKRL